MKNRNNNTEVAKNPFENTFSKPITFLQTSMWNVLILYEIDTDLNMFVRNWFNGYGLQFEVD